MLSHCLNEGKLFINLKKKKKIVLLCSMFEELQAYVQKTSVRAKNGGY